MRNITEIRDGAESGTVWQTDYDKTTKKLVCRILAEKSGISGIYSIPCPAPVFGIIDDSYWEVVSDIIDEFIRNYGDDTEKS